jgi:hypothetical protein
MLKEEKIKILKMVEVKENTLRRIKEAGTLTHSKEYDMATRYVQQIKREISRADELDSNILYLFCRLEHFVTLLSSGGLCNE